MREMMIKPRLSRLGLFSLTFVVTLALPGCSILPGMYASFSKKPEVVASKEMPVDIDYTIFQITPLLVKQLTEQANAEEIASGRVVLPPIKPSYPYRLGPQDSLSISVWGHNELSGGGGASGGSSSGGAGSSSGGSSSGGGRTIDSQGNVFIPLLGKVKASGLTINELRVELTKRYSKFVPDPQVDVNVVSYRSQKVFISGSVGKPGNVSITDQPLRVTDAISSAGGVLEASDLYNVMLTRGNKLVRLNLDRLFYSGDLKLNILLADGDVLTIPNNSYRKVFMLGEVGNSVGSNQSGGVIMRRGRMSLAEVIAGAGGVSPFSGAANQIYVMRANPNIKNPVDAARQPIIYELDAWKPEALLIAEQFPMRSRDLVFVNPTGPTMIGRFIGQFIPLLTSVNTTGGTVGAY